ncbi:hypothetical protein GCM10027028_63960 [Streptomyces sundarbansensis]
MLTAVIAVLGTLARSFVTGALQHFAQRAQRAAEELSARRAAGLDAVADLSAALADHRRAMAVRGEIRLAGGDWSAARSESHVTRSAVTAPLLRVRLVLPELAGAAQFAVQAVYDMRAADKHGGAPGGAGKGAQRVGRPGDRRRGRARRFRGPPPPPPPIPHHYMQGQQKRKSGWSPRGTPGLTRGGRENPSE